MRLGAPGSRLGSPGSRLGAPEVVLVSGPQTITAPAQLLETDFAMDGSRGTVLRRGLASGDMSLDLAATGAVLCRGRANGDMSLDMVGNGVVIRRGRAAMDASFDMNGFGSVIGAIVVITAPPQAGSMEFDMSGFGGVRRAAAPASGSMGFDMSGFGRLILRGRGALSLEAILAAAAPLMFVKGRVDLQAEFAMQARGTVDIRAALAALDFLFEMSGTGVVVPSGLGHVPGFFSIEPAGFLSSTSPGYFS